MAKPLFQKATRSAVKLKLGIQGPSGSGKTLGALAMAATMAGKDRFAVIDTENGSASLYADRFDFDTLNVGPPYTSLAYVEAIKAAVDAGYKVLVIDSLSHQWVGKGGILSRKEDMDARGGNSFANWAIFTKEHEAFKAFLLAADIHIICTLRTKQEYVVEENAKGKQTPRKVGTAAVQREGMEYELSIVFELQMDHIAGTSKDRTGLFDGRQVDLSDSAVAQEISDWLASAAPAVAQPAQSVDPKEYESAEPVPHSDAAKEMMRDDDDAEANAAPMDADSATCPKCGGRMWDNRLTKRTANAPDFKCRSRTCDGVVWPARDPIRGNAMDANDVPAAPRPTRRTTRPATDGEIPF